MSVLTIRDVPDEVRDILAAQAKQRGQSMQAYLLGILRQRADFAYNSELVVEIEKDLLHHGGVARTQDVIEALREARAERDR